MVKMIIGRTVLLEENINECIKEQGNHGWILTDIKYVAESIEHLGSALLIFKKM